MDLISSTCLFCNESIIQNVDIKFTPKEQEEIVSQKWTLFCKYLNLSQIEVNKMTVFYDSCLSSSCVNCTLNLQRIVDYHQQIEQIKLLLQNVVANLSASVISTTKSLNGVPHINQMVDCARQTIASHFAPQISLSHVKVDPKLRLKRQANSDVRPHYSGLNEDDDDCDDVDCGVSFSGLDQNSDSDFEAEIEAEIALKKKRRRKSATNGEKEINIEDSSSKISKKRKRCKNLTKKNLEKRSNLNEKKEKRKRGRPKTGRKKVSKKTYFHIRQLSDGSYEYNNHKFVQCPDNKFFLCESCNVKKTDKYEMTHHIRMKHMGLYSYSCHEEGCSFGARSIAKLVSHHVKFHGAKFGQPEYELIQCSNDRFLLDAFWTFQRLIIHKNDTNGKKKPKEEEDEEGEEETQEQVQEQNQEETSYLYKCLQCLTFTTEDLNTIKHHVRNHPKKNTSDGENTNAANITTTTTTTTLNSTEEPMDDFSNLFIDDQNSSSFLDSSQQTESEEQQTDGNKINRRVKIESLGNGKFVYEGKWAFENTVHGIQCATCLKFYPTRQGILRHIRHNHLPARFDCSSCEQSFRYETNLKSHKCTMKKIGQIIQTSPGKFLYRGVYTFTQIDQDENYQCDICGNVRRGKSGLTGHIREHHERTILFTCDVCGKTFTRKGGFEDHVATHYDARDYICEACGKTWKSANELSKHRRKIHGIMKQYPVYACEEGDCNATFTSKINLQNHRKKEHENHPTTTTTSA